jgi:hypothetical protein
LAWANESWRGFYHGIHTKEELITQLYPSQQDHIDHFYSLLDAFKDKRYIKVDEKPLFMIYQPIKFPNVSEYLDLWRKLAVENGLKGIHFVGHTYSYTDVDKILSLGFDSVEIVRLFDCLEHRTMWGKLKTRLMSKLFSYPRIVPYKEAKQFFVGNEEQKENVYPTIIPNWDHTPRTGIKVLCMTIQLLNYLLSIYMTLKTN